MNNLIIKYINLTEGKETNNDAKKDSIKINKGDKNDGQNKKKCCWKFFISLSICKNLI